MASRPGGIANARCSGPRDARQARPACFRARTRRVVRGESRCGAPGRAGPAARRFRWRVGGRSTGHRRELVEHRPGRPGRSAHRVFFSIKGGVGRSTALAATAWALARQGRRVLVLDLDLESPGLSSSLLPDERRPTFGIADWLVEDLVDNGDAVFADLFATSPLSHDGEIYVVPAHGADPGDYVAKLGRVWMPKVSGARRETWSQRLQRLLDALEARWRPDVVLIDSRAGIDEVASACVTGLGAQRVMLFALDGEQTWTGYRILFRHWRTSGVARDIRERLQLVGAMVPELAGAEYVAGVRERAWDMFAEELYDEVPAGEPVTGDTWSFDESDEGAPHYPWTIRWHRGFAALQSLHARFVAVDPQEVESLFGPVIDGLANFVDGTGEFHGER
ncbi:MinD/ParA family protein [Azotobacter vinelandii]